MVREVVGCVKTDYFLYDEVLKRHMLQGFYLDNNGTYLHRFLRENLGMIGVDRELAERSPQFQQIIPYVIVGSRKGVYKYQRVDPGEKRLANKVAVGFGGHVNYTTSKDGHMRLETVLECAFREINEELIFDCNSGSLSEKRFMDNISYIGTVKDWRTEVSSVHLGLVYFLDIGSTKIKAREPGIRLIDQDAPAADYGKLESWTKMIDRGLDKVSEELPWKVKRNQRVGSMLATYKNIRMETW